MTQMINSAPQQPTITSVQDIIQKCGRAGQLELTQMKKMIQVLASNLKVLISAQDDRKQHHDNNSSNQYPQYFDVFAEKINKVHERFQKVITAVEEQMRNITDSVNRQITQIRKDLQISNKDCYLNQPQQYIGLKRANSTSSQYSNHSQNIDRGVQNLQQNKDQLTQKIRQIMDKLYTQKKIQYEQIAFQKAKQVQRATYQKVDLVWKDIVELYKKQRMLTERLTRISNVVSLFTVISDQNFQPNPIQPGIAKYERPLYH